MNNDIKMIQEIRSSMIADLMELLNDNNISHGACKKYMLHIKDTIVIEDDLRAMSHSNEFNERDNE